MSQLKQSLNFSILSFLGKLFLFSFDNYIYSYYVIISNIELIEKCQSTILIRDNLVIEYTKKDQVRLMNSVGKHGVVEQGLVKSEM